MSGTRQGGLRAAQENKRKYGKSFYAVIGAEGGRRGNTGGFASNIIGADGLTGRQRASVAGKIGGQQSPRKRKRTWQRVRVFNVKDEG